MKGLFKIVWLNYLCNFLEFTMIYLCFSIILSQVSQNLKSNFDLNHPGSENSCLDSTNGGEGETCPWYIGLSFEFLILVFNVFIFTFRSTLSLFKVRRFWILQLCMFAVVSFFFVQSLLMPPFPMWVPLVTIIFSGIIDGITNPNMFYLILSHKGLNYSQKVIFFRNVVNIYR